jgi:hypothetical protein
MAVKQESVKIDQITAASTKHGTIVLGLGDDQKVYYWDSMDHQWVDWANTN